MLSKSTVVVSTIGILVVGAMLPIQRSSAGFKVCLGANNECPNGWLESTDSPSPAPSPSPSPSYVPITQINPTTWKSPIDQATPAPNPTSWKSPIDPVEPQVNGLVSAQEIKRARKLLFPQNLESFERRWGEPVYKSSGLARWPIYNGRYINAVLDESGKRVEVMSLN